jgi:hypothetical protein
LIIDIYLKSLALRTQRADLLTEYDAYHRVFTVPYAQKKTTVPSHITEATLVAKRAELSEIKRQLNDEQREKVEHDVDGINAILSLEDANERLRRYELSSKPKPSNHLAQAAAAQEQFGRSLLPKFHMYMNPLGPSAPPIDYGPSAPPIDDGPSAPPSDDHLAHAAAAQKPDEQDWRESIDPVIGIPLWVNDATGLVRQTPPPPPSSQSSLSQPSSHPLHSGYFVDVYGNASPTGPTGRWRSHI